MPTPIESMQAIRDRFRAIRADHAVMVTPDYEQVTLRCLGEKCGWSSSHDDIPVSALESMVGEHHQDIYKQLYK